MRRFAGWAAAALVLAAVAAGCGSRGGSLVGYQPEGHLNAGSLSVQVDSDHGVLSASALVFMQAPTNRVRLYDDVNHQGYLRLDPLVEPERTFSTGWSIFRTTLSNYDPTASHILLARGSRDGAENVLSPLSNQASIPAGDAFGLVAERDTLPLAPRAPLPSPDAAPPVHVDSLYLHIAAVTQARTIFLEIVRSKVTQYLAMFERQPDDSFTRTIVFENLPPRLGQTYLWHVDEYDRDARLIAATSVTGSFVITAPKVAGNPFEWPTASDRVIFQAWTIPGTVAARPAER